MPRTITTSTRIVSADVQTFVYQCLLTVLADKVLMTWVPKKAGQIISLDFYVDVVTSTASDLSTVTAHINGTATTGGAVALTSANTDGAVSDTVSGSAITGLSKFDADDYITLVGSSTTAFAEGAGSFQLTVEFATQP